MTLSALWASRRVKLLFKQLTGGCHKLCLPTQVFALQQSGKAVKLLSES